MAVEKFRAYVERYPLNGVGGDLCPLAYIAAAAAATGDAFKLEKHLETTRRQDFDAWLAKAFFHAHRREIEPAENALKQAFQRRPHTDYRPIPPEFQFTEAASGYIESPAMLALRTCCSTGASAINRSNRRMRGPMPCSTRMSQIRQLEFARSP